MLQAFKLKILSLLLYKSTCVYYHPSNKNIITQYFLLIHMEVQMIQMFFHSICCNQALNFYQHLYFFKYQLTLQLFLQIKPLSYKAYFLKVKYPHKHEISTSINILMKSLFIILIVSFLQFFSQHLLNFKRYLCGIYVIISCLSKRLQVQDCC